MLHINIYIYIYITQKQYICPDVAVQYISYYAIGIQPTTSFFRLLFRVRVYMDYNKLIHVQQHFYLNSHDFDWDTIRERIEKNPLGKIVVIIEIPMPNVFNINLNDLQNTTLECVYIYPTHPPRVGYDTRSVFSG